MSDSDEGENSGGPAAKRPKKHTFGSDDARLIVILENASLEAGKIGKKHELLSSDKHANFIRKLNKNPADYRPDITHQCLLMLLDSPLNRAGKLQVFVRTNKNVLIEISPQTRLPRTFDRFAGLMVELLHKLQIRAADSSIRLMKVIKNPVSAHLPVGCAKVGTSVQAKEFPENLADYANGFKGPVAIVIGAMAVGKVSVDYTEDEFKMSNYPLSAALACAKLCTAFEQAYGIR